MKSYVLKIAAVILMLVILCSCNTQINGSIESETEEGHGKQTSNTNMDLSEWIGASLPDFHAAMTESGATYKYSYEEEDAMLAVAYLYLYDIRGDNLIVNTDIENGKKVIKGVYLFSKDGNLKQAEGRPLTAGDANINLICGDALPVNDRLFDEFVAKPALLQMEGSEIERLDCFTERGDVYQLLFYEEDHSLFYATGYHLINETPLFYYMHICNSTDNRIVVTQVSKPDRFEVRIYDSNFDKPKTRITFPSSGEAGSNVIPADDSAYSSIKTVQQLIEQYGEPIVRTAFTKKGYYTPQGPAYLYIADDGRVVLFDVDDTNKNVLNVTLLGLSRVSRTQD